MPNSRPIEPQAVLAALAEGNGRFASGRPLSRFSSESREASVAGQAPYAAIVGCSDSRVPVEAVFDAGPGELFVVRTAGHVLAAASLASLHFAVEKLGVGVILVLGHEDCGAVNAALAGSAPEWLAPIIRHIRVDGIDPADAPGDADDALLAAAVDEHVKDTVAELTEYFGSASLTCAPPLIAGAAYKLATGEVHWL